MVKLCRGQKVSSVPFYIKQVIIDYQMCKEFKVLPTAHTLYQEKAKTVLMFQIIEETIAEEEQRRAKKAEKERQKGGRG